MRAYLIIRIIQKEGEKKKEKKRKKKDENRVHYAVSVMMCAVR